MLLIIEKVSYFLYVIFLKFLYELKLSYVLNRVQV